MKEALEQLLRAEEAGRRTAALREAEGRQLVADAETQAAEVDDRTRQALTRSIAALGAESRSATDAELRAIAQACERSIARGRTQAEQRRPEAVRQLVAQLLDEAVGDD